MMPGNVYFANSVKMKGKIKSRQITEYPCPWHEESSPYPLNQFTPSLRVLSESQLTNLSTTSSSSRSSIPVRLAKAVFVGDVGVGKTSLITRFCHDTFSSNQQQTVGIDYEVQRFWVLNVPFNLQIWDTAGQERFKCIAQSYYRGANIVVTVFDAGDLTTLGNCQRWMDDACCVGGSVSGDKVLKFLVGTKMDVVKDRHRNQIHEMGIKMAKLMGAEYWPVSSKSGENLELFFRRLAVVGLEVMLVDEDDQGSRSRSTSRSLSSPIVITVANTSERNKEKCCKS